ncbi:winged helix-turn-helix domain-containing protein [Allosphingosinicella sp.]|jgi:DNA-binding transcriptional ArsR family regulator|uniref:winged helix-turn-helix domain-containing protein n=1 Tax=Allosphingosinicella sp. TaxID=2823234 RepID=UPI002EFFDD41
MAQPPDQDFDYRGIDEVIHGRVRLAIMAYLSGAGNAEFSELKRRAQVNDGNLSVHLRKLEEAGYIEVEKRFVGRKPQTLCRLSDPGREAWIAYIGHMQKLLGGEGGA